jgi:hypothetical protein
VWLTELASHLPSTVQLDGLDVSFEAAPLAKWLPSNVTLRHWNIKEPVPHELVGAYDIVHVRNFLFVLRDSDMPGVLERLVSLLRPGGVLQWGEGDISSFRMQTVDTTVSTSALEKMLEVAKLQDDRLNPSWATQLPILCRDAGLTEVEVDVRDAPPHLVLAMQECNLIMHELIARKTKNQALLQAIHDLMPQAVTEMRQGACWAFTRCTVVGRKKSEEQPLSKPNRCVTHGRAYRLHDSDHATNLQSLWW